MQTDTATRYGTVSRTLHWAMAACYLLMFATALAWNLNDALKPLIKLHKAAGLLLLFARARPLCLGACPFPAASGRRRRGESGASGAVCADVCRPRLRHGAAVSWRFWQRARRAGFRSFSSLSRGILR